MDHLTVVQWIVGGIGLAGGVGVLIYLWREISKWDRENKDRGQK